MAVHLSMLNPASIYRVKTEFTAVVTDSKGMRIFTLAPGCCLTVQRENKATGLIEAMLEGRPIWIQREDLETRSEQMKSASL